MKVGPYDYGARFYDPNLGRFHTVDPLYDQFALQAPFVYANNNPVNLIDFNGEAGQEPDNPTQQAQYNQASLHRFNQIEKSRNSVVTQILTSQGISVSNTTLKAAGGILNKNPTFKDVLAIDERGPISNPQTESRLTGGDTPDKNF